MAARMRLLNLESDPVSPCSLSSEALGPQLLIPHHPPPPRLQPPPQSWAFLPATPRRAQVQNHFQRPRSFLDVAPQTAPPALTPGPLILPVAHPQPDTAGHADLPGGSGRACHTECELREGRPLVNSTQASASGTSHRTWSTADPQ